MSKSVKSITSPKKFIVGQHLLKELCTYTKTYGDHAYVICDEFILERASQEASQSFEEAGHKSEFAKFNLEITQEEIDRRRKNIRYGESSCLLRAFARSHFPDNRFNRRTVYSPFCYLQYRWFI